MKQSVLITILISISFIVILSLSVFGIGYFINDNKKNYETIVEKPSSISASSSTQKQEQTQQAPSVQGDHQIEVETTVPASEFDTNFYVKRMYELKFLFAQNSFNSPTEISPSAIVQYAFCHIYNESLVDMPVKTGLTYREASEAQISTQIAKLFNITRSDITKSDLYNSSKKIFEMWEPKLKTAVYSSSKLKKLSDNNYEITATYYKTKDKSSVMGTSVGVFEKNSNGIYITKMMVN